MVNWNFSCLQRSQAKPTSLAANLAGRASNRGCVRHAWRWPHPVCYPVLLAAPGAASDGGAGRQAKHDGSKVLTGARQRLGTQLCQRWNPNASPLGQKEGEKDRRKINERKNEGKTERARVKERKNKDR